VSIRPPYEGPFRRLYQRFFLAQRLGRLLRIAPDVGGGGSGELGTNRPNKIADFVENSRARFGPINVIGEDLAKVFDIKRRLIATSRLDISKRHWILVRFGAPDRDGKFDNTPSGMG
jgi:hypothetical protein